MNIGLSILGTQSPQSTYSVEQMLNIELNLNTAETEFIDAVRGINDLNTVVDNVISLNSVARKFSGKESLEVMKSLVGNQLQGISMEGFIKSAWEKLVKWVNVLWQKFKKFMSFLWAKIKGIFVKKKASSKAALAFAKKHPEAAKAVETPAKGSGSGGAPKGSAGHSTPGQLEAICEAASNVPVPAKAKEKVKIPNPKFIKQIAEKISKEFDTVVKAIDKKLDFTHIMAEIMKDSASENVELFAGCREIMQAESTEKVVALFGGSENLMKMLTHPQEHFSKIQATPPSKLGDVSEALKNYRFALDLLNATAEMANNLYKELSETCKVGNEKLAEMDKKEGNAGKTEAASLLMNTVRKVTAVANLMSNGITSYTKYIAGVSNKLAAQEALLLDVEEAASRMNGPDPDEI